MDNADAALLRHDPDVHNSTHLHVTPDAERPSVVHRSLSSIDTENRFQRCMQILASNAAQENADESIVHWECMLPSDADARRVA